MPDVQVDQTLIDRTRCGDALRTDLDEEQRQRSETNPSLFPIARSENQRILTPTFPCLSAAAAVPARRRLKAERSETHEAPSSRIDASGTPANLCPLSIEDSVKLL